MRRMKASKAVDTKVRFKGGINHYRIVEIDTSRKSMPVRVIAPGCWLGYWCAWRELELAEGGQ